MSIKKVMIIEREIEGRKHEIELTMQECLAAYDVYLNHCYLNDLNNYLRGLESPLSKKDEMKLVENENIFLHYYKDLREDEELDWDEAVEQAIESTLDIV